MFFIFILVAFLLLLDIAALRWGYDSRKKLTGEEWEREQKHAVRALAVGYPVEPEPYVVVKSAPRQQLVMQCHS